MQPSQDLVRGFKGPANLVFTMRRRNKSGLEGRWREVDSCVQHAMEEALEHFDVRRSYLGKAAYFRSIRKYESEHAPGVLYSKRDTVSGGDRVEAFNESPGHVPQPGVEIRRIQQFQRLQPGGHGHRVSRQRTGLVDRTVRSQSCHEVGPAAECRCRHAAADNLAQSRQVRGDVIQSLRTAFGDAKACHDLVKDQYGTRFRTLVA